MGLFWKNGFIKFSLLQSLTEEKIRRPLLERKRILDYGVQSLVKFKFN